MRFTCEDRSKNSGFTLVEMLVVSPLLVLIVAVLIGFFVTLTGDALRMRERNTFAYSIQNALHEIERDIRYSTGVVYQTGTLQPGQGSNSSFTGTSPFTTNSNTLVLELRATDKNPLDPSRKFLYYANSPNPCNGTLGPEYNETVSYQVIYFLDSGNLTKRTIVDFGGRTVCGVSSPSHAGIFQYNSCKNTASEWCYARDAIIATNVNSLNFQYYLTPTSTSAVTPSANVDIVSVNTSIQASKEVAGSTISHSMSLRASRIN
jgi:type II secretory pathway pseudopilin PulG